MCRRPDAKIVLSCGPKDQIRNPSQTAARSDLKVTPKYRTLVDALYAAPADRRFVTYWVDEDEHESVTFGEFRQRAQIQAALLHDNDVHAGDRVVLIMPQGIPLMTAFAGATLLGAVPAILAYPNFKVEPAKYRFGLQGVTSNLQARAVVIDNEFPDDLLEHVALGDDARLVRAVTANDSGDTELPEAAIASNALAFIQHSAGTTGLQKGVALTHAAVLHHLEHLSTALHIDGEHDSVYSWLPLYHDMGLIACFMLPMVCHLPVVMQSPLDWVMHPDTMLEIFAEHKCTVAWLPNFAF
jgi:fatty-acyl-CoA synthase